MDWRMIGGVLSLLILTGTSSTGQQYFYNDKYYDSDWLLEAGIHVGVMNSLTDLGGRKGKGGSFLKDYQFRNNSVSFGGQVSMLYNYQIGLVLQYTHGLVSAQDSTLQSEKAITGSRYQRNLHFRSTIDEWMLAIEWHFVRSFQSTDKYSPYLSAGIGYYRFRPQTFYAGKWIDLQPLHTEGQGFNEYADRSVYSLQQMNLPIGIGLMYELSAITNLRLDLVHRILFTDYLDDVSTNYINPALYSKYLSPQAAELALALSDRRNELNPGFQGRVGDKRGNPSRNDSYFTINLKMSFVLNRKRR